MLESGSKIDNIINLFVYTKPQPTASFEKNTLSVQNFIRNSITEKGVEKRGLCPSVVELVFSILGLYTASQIKSVSFQVVYFVGISWHSAVLACLMPRNLDCLSLVRTG